MAARDLGTKRACTECGAKFYDLGKMPVECPKCEVSFVPAILLPPKEQRPVDPKPSPAKKPAEVPAANDDDDDADDDDDEVAAIADVDLGDDDDSDDDTKADDATLLDTDGEDEPDVSGLVGGASGDEKEG